MSRPQLVFVSPRFLFPNDSGGKIRTTNILRGMKGGHFEITMVTPLPAGAARRHGAEIDSVCDHLLSWPEPAAGGAGRLARYRHLGSRLPFPVATDRSATGSEVVGRALANGADLVVFDFLHSVVLAPDRLPCPSVLFTHNVETEIFARHAEVAGNPLMRRVWRSQHRKMDRYERASVPRFDTVVAVSERDGEAFRGFEGSHRVAVIPTGVDLDFFAYGPPGDAPRVVFTGSMDWLANVDGIGWFMPEIWPLIAAEVPEASMKVVGRNPPATLAEQAGSRGLAWEFTGFVDDVRPHVRGTAVYVVPLRVGGGTRIKVFEAMAMGVPVVSTSLGVEGLPLEDGRHYLCADTPRAMADAVVRLLRDPALGRSLSQAARRYVEDNFSAGAVAGIFEDICVRTADGADG